MIYLLFPPHFITLAANVTVAIKASALAATYAISAMLAQSEKPTLILAVFASPIFTHS
jgi:hypothetical protein